PLTELFARLAPLPLGLFHRPAGLRGTLLAAGHFLGGVRGLAGRRLHRFGRPVATFAGLVALALATGVAGGLHLVAGPLGAAGRVLHLRARGPFLTAGVAGQVVQLFAHVAGLFLQLLLPGHLLGRRGAGVLRQLIQLLVHVRLPPGQVLGLLPRLAARLVLGHLLHRLRRAPARLPGLIQVAILDLAGRLLR